MDSLHGNLGFLSGGGAMAREVAAFDWGATPLGPIEGWPAALKISVATVLNSPFPAFIAWGSDLISIHNDAYRPMLGDKPAPLGRRMCDNWAECWDTLKPYVDAALRGEATFIEDFELECNRFGHPETAYFTFSYSPLRDEHGVIHGFMDTVMETTSAVLARRAERLRNSELMHRLKNTLAIVSAIANQTYRTSENVTEANERLTRRLTTLGKAQSVLVGDAAEAAEITAVVEGVLEPFRQGCGQVQIEGPDLQLTERHVFSLALALNELASNATKYGALTVPQGRISLAWTVDDDAFTLEWRETGGPPVTEPTTTGFGSFLIRHVLADDFNGDVTIDYLPGGLVCRLTTALPNLTFRRSTAVAHAAQ